jgi:hypothetical protein
LSRVFLFDILSLPPKIRAEINNIWTKKQNSATAVRNAIVVLNVVAEQKAAVAMKHATAVAKVKKGTTNRKFK